MKRWIAVLLLQVLLVGGCAFATQVAPIADSPRSLQDKGGPVRGGM